MPTHADDDPANRTSIEGHLAVALATFALGGDPVDRPGLNDRKLPASEVLSSLA